ncbi:MAG: polyprenyl synthetase family protein [Anaerolineales bacterium]
MRIRSNEYHPELQAALEHLTSSGGKRIRPIVTLLTGEMLGAESERLITLAAAIELLHTATLVHDDLIDGSLLRRGIPTINARWSPAATVLAGDFIFARAAMLAAETDSVDVMRLFAQTLATIVSGEITQLFARKGEVLRDEYFQRIYAKTASMFVLASKSAALISPVSPDVYDKLRTYGYQIGMAFQIVDDVLDFTGEQATVGKPVANDLRQGLVTLPAIYYYESFPDDQDMISVLDGVFQNEEKLNRLAQSIRNSDAIGFALAEAENYVDRALKALRGLPNNQHRQALESLAEYVINRKI